MKRYFLLTLGPGLTACDTCFAVIVEFPKFRIVEKVEHCNTVYQRTHKGFAGACLTPGHPSSDFAVTTEAEVLLGRFSPLRIESLATSTKFNDLHHLAYKGGQLAVANSGTDTIELLDDQLNHRETISLINIYKPGFRYASCVLKDQVRRGINRIRSKDVADYSHLTQKRHFANLRKVMWKSPVNAGCNDVRCWDMRPHFLHPNHIAHSEGEWRVTLYAPGVQLGIKSGKRFCVGLDRPHDGIEVNGSYVFTECRANTVAIVEPNEEIDRFVVSHGIEPGFLRGVVVLDDLIVCGLSALREKGRIKEARMVGFSRSRGEVNFEWRIPLDYGSSIYSIIDVTPFYS